MCLHTVCMEAACDLLLIVLGAQLERHSHLIVPCAVLHKCDVHVSGMLPDDNTAEYICRVSP